MHIRKHAVFLAVIWLWGISSTGWAEVVDFSHLMGEVDEAIAEADDYEPPARAGGGAADPVLASRVAELEDRILRRNDEIAELEERLERRDRQVEQLKDALEETTTEFSERLRRLRAQTQDQEPDTEALDALQAELDEKSAEHENTLAELAEASEELAAAHRAQEDAQQEREEMQDTIASLEAKVASAEEAKESAFASALTHFSVEYEETVGSVRARYEEEMERLQQEHAAELAAAKARYDALKAETADDREKTEELRRREESRLEAAMRLEKRRQDRERFLLAYNSGSLLLSVGAYERAEDELLQALSIQENDATLHYKLGVLYHEHKPRPDRARYHYERFLELAPDDEDAPRVQDWLGELE